MIVVDTNVLFGWFWKGSANRQLILASPERLLAPEKALEELETYRGVICKKIGISSQAFSTALKELTEHVSFEKRENYATHMKRAIRLSPDPNDAEFFALCLARASPLWSQDKLLQEQREVRVITTAEVIEAGFFV